MKKNIMKRGFLGFPLGIAIGFVITVIISACIGDGSFYPVTAQLIETMGNELNAVILQTILFGILFYVGTFVLIFLIAWLFQYLAWKNKIRRMNEKVKSHNAE